VKEFISHIDYLIQKHDCVIIPDFGGFVLSHEGAIFASDGSVSPPKLTVGFNPDLKYNDGLLAESYMSVYSIAYDDACKRIAESVSRLNTILGMRHPIQIGRLGKLSLDEYNRLLFTPNANFSILHPDTFGLSDIHLKRLSDIQTETVRIQKRTYLHRIAKGAAAAAAAIVLFFIASTPIEQNIETQKSSLFSDLLSSTTTKASIQPEITKPEVSVVEEPAVEVQEEAPAVEEPKQEAPKAAEEKAISTDKKTTPQKVAEETIQNKVVNNYYVIIGGAGSKNEAQRLLNRYKSQGFSDAGIVSSSNRIRIYVESFASRKEAERYLDAFKYKHPDFYDAWVYYQR
jgi:cell division septation protein DedD